MKHALVVYESMFGNTQAIAVAVADLSLIHISEPTRPY
jgi:flavodoxin